MLFQGFSIRSLFPYYSTCYEYFLFHYLSRCATILLQFVVDGVVDRSAEQMEKIKKISTDRELKALKSNGKKYRRAIDSKHGGGLSVMVLPSGRIQFLLRYRKPINKKQTEITLPAAQLSSARELHLQCIEWLKHGKDPALELKQSKSNNSDAITMNELFLRWFKFYSSTPSNRTKLIPSEKAIYRQNWRWNFYLSKTLGPMLAKDVHRTHLILALETVAERSREEARKCLSTLRGMLDYGLDRLVVEDNVSRAIDPGRIGLIASRPRDRVLSMDDLNILWSSIESSTLNLIAKSSLKALIITGCRRNEVVGAKWNEFNLETRCWTIPKTRMKNRIPHEVYISDLLLEILKEMRPLTYDSGYLFNSPRKTSGPMHPDSLNQAFRRMVATTSSTQIREWEAFTIHDLRRSARTAWAQHCKIQPHIAESMLSHLPSVLVQTYDRSSYWDEKCAGWAIWSDILASTMGLKSIDSSKPSSVPYLQLVSSN